MRGFWLEKGAKKEPKRVPRGSQNRDFWSKNGYQKRFKYTLRLRRDFKANCIEISAKVYNWKLQLKPEAQRVSHFALKA